MGQASQTIVQDAVPERPDRKLWRSARTAWFIALLLWSWMCLYGASDLLVWRWSVIIAWPIGLWVVVLIHELGHAAAAWMAGWRVAAVAVGPVGFHWLNKEFAFVPRSKRTEFEGFVLPLPSRPEVWTLGREMLISAGGPAANLLFAAILFSLWRYAPEPISQESVDLSLVAFSGALGSLCIGVGALMPAPEGQSASDGDHLRGAGQTSVSEWKRSRAIAYLHALLHYQLRLRDLPLWIVDEASKVATEEGGELRRLQDTIVIGMLLDSAPVDLVETRRLLDEYRQRHGASEWLDNCDAYFAAVWERDGATARSRLWRGEGVAELKPLALAAEAAVLAREGEPNAARGLVGQMRAANRERAIFPDHTFRDIGRQIEALLPG